MSSMSCPGPHRARRLYLHHWEIHLAAVGPGVQQLRAGGESSGHHQQDHGAGVGLLCRHLSRQLYSQSGCLHDPGGVRGHRVWAQRPEGVYREHVTRPRASWDVCTGGRLSWLVTCLRTEGFLGDCPLVPRGVKMEVYERAERFKHSWGKRLFPMSQEQ